MSKPGKRMRAALEARDRVYGLEEAMSFLKGHASRKFDETIELAVNLGVDPRHSDQTVRGVCKLPHGTGKSVRVAVFARDEKAKEAVEAGAHVVGAEELMESVQGGKLDFDRVVATPDMMSLVGRLGKILGPRGLMPNPRVGTVTPDVSGAVKAAMGGSIEFRAEKAGVVHAGVGKASFSEEALSENIKALMSSLLKAKPTGSKGSYVKKVAVSSTHGAGLCLDMKSLLANLN